MPLVASVYVYFDYLGRSNGDGECTAYLRLVSKGRAANPSMFDTVLVFEISGPTDTVRLVRGCCLWRSLSRVSLARPSDLRPGNTVPVVGTPNPIARICGRFSDFSEISA